MVRAEPSSVQTEGAEKGVVVTRESLLDYCWRGIRSERERGDRQPGIFFSELWPALG